MFHIAGCLVTSMELDWHTGKTVIMILVVVIILIVAGIIAGFVAIQKKDKGA